MFQRKLQVTSKISSASLNRVFVLIKLIATGMASEPTNDLSLPCTLHAKMLSKCMAVLRTKCS